LSTERAARTRREPLSGPIRKILTGIGLFGAVCLIAVIGYMLAGWRLDDAIYMVIITIFGVGYGEVQPIESPALRALTITVIIAGYGAVIYTIGGFVQMLIDGELNKALGARRMTKEIEALDGHTIVCGVGRMGTILARDLHSAGKPFVVVDMDEHRLKRAEEEGYLVVEGDATEESILEQAGIMRAGVLASVLSEDATNVFVTITARAMNPDLFIVARGENPRTERKLLVSGANKVVLPTAIGATKVAQLIIRPSAESMLGQLTSQSDLGDELGQIGLQFGELTVEDGSPLVGRSLSAIEVRSNHGFLIVALKHRNGATIVNPPADTALEAGDVVIVLGHDDDIPQLAERFAASRKTITYRGVTLEG